MPAKPRFRKDRQSWEVVVTEEGKPPRRIPFGREANAEEQARAFAARLNEHDVAAVRFRTRGPSDPLPIDQTARDWYAAHLPTFSKGYAKLADGIIRNHLAPHFGARDLRDLTEADVLPFATKLVSAGLSTAVAGHGLSILRRICRLHARQLGGVNPMLGFDATLKKMRRQRTKRARMVDAWTLEELQGIFELARKFEPWLYDKVIFASHTGTRQAETFGVRWCDVDFARGVVAITGQIQDGEESLTKEGDESPKRIPLWVFGPELRTVLEQLAEKRHVREAWREPGLVFLAPDEESPIKADGYFRGAYKRLQTRMVEAKIRPLVWHSFRHTFITHLLEAGRSPKKVGEWVGHSTTYITEKYAHALPDAPDGKGVLELAAPPAKLRAVE